MAFDGTLLKIGTYKFPLKYIEYDTYKVTLNTQDLDSKRATTGILHRTVIDHIPVKVQFSLLSDLTNTIVSNIMSNIKSNYISTKEKSANLTIFVPEKNDYITQKCYLNPSMEFPIKEIDVKNKIIIYSSISFSWTGY